MKITNGPIMQAWVVTNTSASVTTQISSSSKINTLEPLQEEQVHPMPPDAR